MITTTTTDGEIVEVTLIITGLFVPPNMFGGSKVKGKFAQSERDDETQFIVAYTHGDSNLVIILTERTLDVECKLKNNSGGGHSRLRFPEPIIPGDARYKIKNDTVKLFLPKVDPSQSWVGALTGRGLEEY
ncbi:unnamed protein product [Hymenolepis diminuta]|uniref:CS domain-containing protein n=1 Tax=Hymenolepis diminuta TaxID=6216 RepID=A0A564Z988_HYMDI|nr:unnamed protein product [Hymenolepis diminuta]